MTSVLAIKPGHDGSVAFVSAGELIFSIEGEKDSYERHAEVGVATLETALKAVPHPPDVVATGGWYRPNADPGDLRGGYLGLEAGSLRSGSLFGRPTLYYSASHERSHIYASVGMSDLATDQELAVLVWEGQIGSFYRWRESGHVLERFPVLDQPGSRYAALYALADPQFPDRGSNIPNSYAGKLMALAGCADGQDPTEDSRLVAAALLTMRVLNPLDKARFEHSSLYNCGIPSPELCRAARLLSTAIFDRFASAARVAFCEPLPLVIGGGCGLNCEWNSQWESSEIFQEVSVPPCPNDSGSAIGTAVDALSQLGHEPQIAWSVYSGEAFVEDIDPLELGLGGSARPVGLPCLGTR